MIDLHPDEEIKLVVRKHWFILVGKLFTLFIFLLLPLGLYLLVRTLSGFADTEVLATFGRMVDGSSLVFGTLLWFFFVWIWGFIIWTDYYLDIWIVTNERIFDIEQRGFFRREISTFRTDRVQDITTEVRGLIPTFFNFGDIHVQTAGENRSFVMAGAPAPTQLKLVISSLQSRSREEGL